MFASAAVTLLLNSSSVYNEALFCRHTSHIGAMLCIYVSYKGW